MQRSFTGKTNNRKVKQTCSAEVKYKFNYRMTMKSVMTLKIDRVYDQHFTTYFFEAENKLGKVTHEVTLSPGES